MLRLLTVEFSVLQVFSQLWFRFVLLSIGCPIVEFTEGNGDPVAGTCTIVEFVAGA